MAGPLGDWIAGSVRLTGSRSFAASHLPERIEEARRAILLDRLLGLVEAGVGLCPPMPAGARPHVPALGGVITLQRVVGYPIALLLARNQRQRAVLPCEGAHDVISIWG